MSRKLLLTMAAVLAMLALASPATGIVVARWAPFFAAQAPVANFGSATRPFGIAAGDTKLDLVVGRTTANVAFLKGNGDPERPGSEVAHG